MREIELLAPAGNAEIAIEAILHGADAVYIGPEFFGARKASSNSTDDIRKVVEFAHPFGAKVYATVNTIIYENELLKVERLIRDLYLAGVDALIVQDMGILRLDIPPIALHASTQCDTRTPEKARFLQDVGFSQIVLARELTLGEIKEICDNVNVPVETFVHGALCVSYSGRCHASWAAKGRSANRGECAQICRLPFTLKDADGRIICADRHLLSLKDLNLSRQIPELLKAGVSSFKIEGRLKEKDYVKNIIGFYRQIIDNVISAHPSLYRRSSAGTSIVNFTPNPEKSFNRGFTTYFLDNRRPESISSPLTPKSMGETIRNLSELHNGDGISYFNGKNEYIGTLVNGIRDGRIITREPLAIPRGATIYRTSDIHWRKSLSRPTANRRLYLDIELGEKYFKASDERGVSVIIPNNTDMQPSLKPSDIRGMFDKFGNTIYQLRDFKNLLGDNIFIPASQLSSLRKDILKAISKASKATYPFELRKKEDSEALYPAAILDYQENVANSKARAFYLSHGVRQILPAMEIEKESGNGKNNPIKSRQRSVMTTRHCILREMGKCLKETPQDKRGLKLPLRLISSNMVFPLQFDCNRCEMHLLHS